MFINANGFKVRISEVKYETDGKEVTRGHANASLFQPATGWVSLGEVSATVKLCDGDVFNEETGKKLVFNILQRKALNRFKRKVEIYLKNLVILINTVTDILQKLENTEDDMTSLFKTMSN